MRVGSWLGGLIMCAALAGACSKQAALRNPAPLSAAWSPDATQQAILEALPMRHWTAEEVQAGRIVAFLPIRTHLVRVEILYDAQAVSIHYLSSENVGEQQGSDGQLYAHRNVNKWMQNLALDIQHSVAVQRSRGPVQASAGAQVTSGAASPPPPPAQPFATVPVVPASK